MSMYKWSSTAAANATADGSINWAEGQAPSTVNDSARGMMAATAKFRNDISGVTTGGSSTAYTITSNQNFDTLAHLSGNIICIIPHTTSGAAPTLNVDGLGAFAINQSTGVAIPTGALIAATPYLLLYANATTEFLFLGAAAVTIGTIQANAVTSTAIAAGAVVYSKIQNVASVHLLGNPSSTSSASPSEIGVGTGLIFSGGNLKTGGPPTYQVFTSGVSSTYTQTSSNITWIEVMAVAGGGASQGTSAGGDTTFNSVVAKGGSAGAANSGSSGGAGGAGGTGGSGTATERRDGLRGGAGQTVGQGGTSFAGKGGHPGISAFAGAVGAGAPGTDGGGLNSGGTGGGGGGEYFLLVISSPSSTYVYTVNAAVTSAGAGKIVVKECYG